MSGMADEKLWRHPVSNRVKASNNERYMELNGFVPYDGEYERDKRTGVLSADMSLVELKEEAAERGLPTSGTKATLLERIAQDAVDNQTSSTSAGDEEGSDSAPGGE